MDELCTLVYIQAKHTTGPGKPTKDGEMNHVTLSSRTFRSWRSEAKHAISDSERFPQYSIIKSKRRRNICFIEMRMYDA